MSYPATYTVPNPPPPVKNWLDINRKFGACPDELGRQVVRIRRMSERLASAEERLAAAQADAENGVAIRPSTMESLRARVAVYHQWVDYAVGTMANTLRFAVARISPDTADGQLLRKERPGRYGTYRQAYWRKTRHFASQFEFVVNALAVRAGVSETEDGEIRVRPGNSRAKVAMEKLYVATKAARDAYKHKVGIEVEDAEQEALIGVIDAARTYDVTHSSMAQFPTYSGPKIRRSMQKRSAGAAKPGYTVRTIDGERKTVAVSSLSIYEGDDQHADAHHPAARHVEVGLEMDMAQIIGALDPSDRELLQRRFIDKESVTDIATALGVSAGTVSRRVKALRDRIAGYMEE